MESHRKSNTPHEVASHSAPARTAKRADGRRIGAKQDAPPTNRASNKCNPGESGTGEEGYIPYFQPLRWGVDTLYFSCYGELLPTVEKRLAEKKKLAQSSIAEEQAEAQLQIGNHVFEVKDKGTKLYPYVLEDGAFRVQLSRSKKLPWAYVKVSSGYLAAYGPFGAENALLGLLEALGEVIGALTVGRIDLFVDFASSEDMESWDREAWVTRAQDIDAHSVDGHFTGWSIGKGGVMSSRLYDKTLEIKVSGKDYLLALWKEARWNGAGNVWRNEFQFRREILKQLGLTTLQQVMDNQTGLWSYASTEWLRLTLPQEADKTRSRWPLHPLWGYISSIDWNSPGGPLRRKFSAQRLPKDDRLFSMAMAPMVAFMAREGILDVHQGHPRFMMEFAKYFARLAEFRGIEFEDLIAEKVRLKARSFNSLLNQTDEEWERLDVERRARAYARVRGD